MELGGGDGENFDFFEGYFTKSSINGILVIAFSDRVQNYLLKDMKITMVVKLLGRNIGYVTLQNRILSLWKPSKSFQIMDVENGPSRLSVQQKKFLEEIGGLISKVAKLDFNIDNRLRGQFARMAIFELCLLSTGDRVALKVNEGLKESASVKGVSMDFCKRFDLGAVNRKEVGILGPDKEKKDLGNLSCGNLLGLKKQAENINFISKGIGLSKEDTYASGFSNMGPTGERKTTGNLGPGYGSWASPSNGGFEVKFGANASVPLKGGDLSNPDSGGSNPKMWGSIGKGTAIGKWRVLNKTIKDLRDHFKVIKNTKTSLSWEGLNSVLPNKDTPWIVIGDFNVIPSSSEKKGGRRERKRCSAFGNFTEFAKLHDLGFKDLSFTWQRCGVFERLDRAICNDAWISDFPSCSMPHLPRLKSDHLPLFFALRHEPSLIKENPFPNLFQKDVRVLAKAVTDEEIKFALFDMVPLKALGSDSLHALSFLSQWEHIGSFEVFPKIIAQEQVGFIAGRNIIDNVIITQEVIHSMRSKQKNRKWMVVNIDLEKAYDRVLWDFIEAFLQVTGIL
ncbi:hypothetical protein Gotri_021982, partial [Gossypium trilobum]|nr:hypothetical protein [Gossypium trilobum]